MSEFENSKTESGFTMKLWRGERTCLIGFNVADPEEDFVGFAIEFKPPGKKEFLPIRNRIAFAYSQNSEASVDGSHKFDSTQAPFQKFRWVHFPFDPEPGMWTYRGTKMHMPVDGQLTRGMSIELQIDLDPVCYPDIIDIGFTRGFASSQAFLDRVPDGMTSAEFGNILIPKPEDGLDHKKGPREEYEWLSFEAGALIFNLLREVVDDESTTLDALIYDFNEPEMLSLLEALGDRLRVVIDDSKNHKASETCETRAASALKRSAGSGSVKRTHFGKLQHHKVLIARRGGIPYKVLCGSTNFSFRGLYIQNNNALLFMHEGVTELYGKLFDEIFESPENFKDTDLARRWHVVETRGPRFHFCFSPHSDTGLSLAPVGGAIDQAAKAVLYNIAFLAQIKSGPTFDSIERLHKRPIFSYGVSNKETGMDIIKPDGTADEVSFAYLAKNTPEPFRQEWSGGSEINVHNKFVVTDFNLPSAKVFTGSSNLSDSGESENGDHLIMIEDRKIALAYAIDALLVFDHLHFRASMQKSFEKSKAESRGYSRDTLSLRKPSAISGEPAWFEKYYVEGSQKEGDRKLFST